MHEYTPRIKRKLGCFAKTSGFVANVVNPSRTAEGRDCNPDAFEKIALSIIEMKGEINEADKMPQPISKDKAVLNLGQSTDILSKVNLISKKQKVK